MDKINEKEFEVISRIAKDNITTQRELSIKAGISLGMTNIMLKRLVRKGYLKIIQLNRKKVQYLLTPKGFAEKTKKSYRYLVKTINLFEEAKKRIHGVLISEIKQGNKKFFILGEGELVTLIEIVLKEIKDEGIQYSRINGFDEIKGGDSILLTANGRSYKRMPCKRINILDYLGDMHF